MALVYLSIFSPIFNCGGEENLQRRVILRGKTMGTTYKIIMNLPVEIKNISTIDHDTKKILNLIIASMSTYDPNSEIFKINLQKHTNWISVTQDFGKVLRCAQNISHKTHGYLDISIGRAINFWGFGAFPLPHLSPTEIPKNFQNDGLFLSPPTSLPIKIRKKTAQTILDVSSLAKGFAVDTICSYLEKKSIVSYMVEIGGELRVGEKDEDRNWSIGIQKPSRNQKHPAIQKILFLSKISLATSGNYQQYIHTNGKFYSHIIDPKLKQPAKQNHIGSVSVLHKECMVADAFATALFAMPLELAIATCKRLKIQAYFLLKKNEEDWEEIYTENFANHLSNNKPITSKF